MIGGDSTRFSKLNFWEKATADWRKKEEIPEHWQAMQTWKPLTDEELNEMFFWYDCKSMRKFEWKAYPNYEWIIDNWQSIEEEDERIDMLTFNLDNSGLYYINGIEFGTSAQEVLVVGAKNVSNLIIRDLSNNPVEKANNDEC